MSKSVKLIIACVLLLGAGVLIASQLGLFGSSQPQFDQRADEEDIEIDLEALDSPEGDGIQRLDDGRGVVQRGGFTEIPE